jgi:uncharacterized protein (DUF2267 family)
MTSISHVWDKALASSRAWLEQLSEDLGWEDAGDTLLALRSVLHALRDRLPPDEAVELAAQLPLLIKGVYFDGWNPSATPVRIRSPDEFFARVLGPFQRGLLHADVERITRSVFRLLAERVSPGEIRDVKGALPAELAQLWPEPAAAR